MSLLKEFLLIDSDRRSAQTALRQESLHRRLRIEELSQEARRKRDEINMLEQGLSRLSSDLIRLEQEILELDQRREEYEREATERKANILSQTLEADTNDALQFIEEYRHLRANYTVQRERLQNQPDAGRLIDSYYQLERFLKDPAHPIPDAARMALQKERSDLLAKIGPLVSPPPSPQGTLKTTMIYSADDGEEPRALVAIALPRITDQSDPNDLAAALLFGAYALAIERLGPQLPAPQCLHAGFVFDLAAPADAPAEFAFELFSALEDGLKKTADTLTIRCEITGLYVEPEIALAVFPRDFGSKEV